MLGDDRVLCPICDYSLPECECPQCEECGRIHRKECTVEHGVMNYYVLRGPIDLGGGRSWVLDIHANFLMNSDLPAPMVSIGRTAIVYVVGLGNSVGLEVRFPATRHEINRAIDCLKRLERDSRKVTSNLN